MFLAMGVGAYAAGIFHLYTHAFFKALLFLGSGAVIHALAGRAGPAQHGRAEEIPADHLLDVPDRRAGDRRRPARCPASSARTRSCSRPTPRSRRPGHTLLWVIGVVTSLLTATYMFRLVFLTFHGERRHDAPAAPAHAEEEEPVAQRRTAHGTICRLTRMLFRLKPEATPALMRPRRARARSARSAAGRWRLPLILLAVGSIFAGYVGVPHALGGSNRIEIVPRAVLRGARRAAAVTARGRGCLRRTCRGRRGPRRGRRTPTPAPS